MEGRLIGQYRVIGVLGEGGMGVVYAARHTLLGRPAAVKVLLPKLSDDQQTVNRFFNEARAATAIRHPGIVEVYDFGWTAEGAAFIVMEHLQGETLRARRKRGPLPWNLALAMTRQIAGALGAAHATGIVHRDLKPDNIFLVADPEVPGGERIKLLDFGIAKLVGTEAGPSMTRTGAVIGTPTYMAPEQCRGIAVDSRADLYSLGCILFELIGDRPPFVGQGAGEVLAAHIHVPPPALGSLARGLPNEVEDLVQRLLAKALVDRVQTAEEVIRLIDAAGTTLGGRDALTSSSLSLLPPRAPLQPPVSPAAHGASPAGGPLSADTTLSRAISSSHRVPSPPAKHRRLALIGAAGGAVALAAVIARSVGGGHEEPAVAIAPASSLYGTDASVTVGNAEAVPVPPSPPPPSPSPSAATSAPPSSPPSSLPTSPASVHPPPPSISPAPSTSTPSPRSPPSSPPARTPAKIERSPSIRHREPPPKPELAPVTLERPAPPAIEARIDSSPPGAEIVLDGKGIGKTPFRGPLPRAGSAVKLSLRLSGYAQYSLTVNADAPIHQVVTLVPTKRDGVVNPFK